MAPAIDVRQSYTGADLVATLERAAHDVGLPKTIRVDNRPGVDCEEDADVAAEKMRPIFSTNP